MYEKLVVVTLKTRLEELVERFNTREQAKFYIEHMGLNFAEYDREHMVYTGAVRRLRRQVEGLLPKAQFIERGFLPGSPWLGRPDPAFRARVPTDGEMRPVGHLVSNSLGFGGNTVSLVFGRA